MKHAALTNGISIHCYHVREWPALMGGLADPGKRGIGENCAVAERNGHITGAGNVAVLVDGSSLYAKRMTCLMLIADGSLCRTYLVYITM